VKKVLIITYYWPPSGGAGVQRWLKFAKYLPQFGWQPIVYTPENPDFSLQDASLQNDIPKEAIVLKTKIWEPYRLYKLFSGKKGENANAGFFTGGKKSWKQRLSIFVRGNFFIPDPRVFWVKPSVKHLIKHLEENPVDAIVSTGPPHSMHLIALGLKKHFPNIKWIADFRDPWTEIDFYQDLNLTSWADKKHKRLEAEVLRSADEVITVSQNWAKDFERNHKRNVTVITNGYDEDDFKNLPEIDSSKTVITHLGSINKDRNPHVLWKAINELINENSDIKNKLCVQFIGNIDVSINESVNKHGLKEVFKHIPYLSHKEAIEEASKSSALLLLINDTPNLMGIIPGKLFEYLAMNRHIINIGPKEGDSSIIISQCSAGLTIGFSDISILKSHLLDLINGKKSISCNTSQYTRKVLTQQLTQILEK
jgi:glycosyltransferase involved in cell wall biosynthesis